WANNILAANPNISDFYWVTPDDFATGSLKQRYYPAVEPKNLGKTLTRSGRDKVLYCSTSGVVQFDAPPDYKLHPGKWRMVQFHKRTLNEMPDMHGQKVLLTTDLDFFDNRGFDTGGKAKVKWTGDAGFEQYLTTLDQRGIRPIYHFVS